MSLEIGNAAGIVWSFLSENGASSVNKISTETGIGKNDIHRAIGWLAREEKIVIDNSGRNEVIALA